MTAQPYALAVVVASAGGIEAFSTIAQVLPASISLAIALVIHRPARAGSDLLVKVVQRRTNLRVKVAEQGGSICNGWIYLAPGGCHLIVQSNEKFGLSHTAKVHHTRPAGDVLFASAAEVFGTRLIAIVLTGAAGDGADGLVEVKRFGGTTIVQSTDTATHPSMPRAAIASGATDRVLPLAAIGPALERLATCDPP